MSLKISNFNINSLMGNGATSLFDTLGKSRRSNGGMGMLQYNTVNTASYNKALRAYYQKQSGTASKLQSTDDTKMASLKDVAANLKASASVLNASSLYQKDENGEYKLEDIKKAVNSFVENYNKTVSETEKADSMDTLRNGVWMVTDTQKNANVLKNAGITIGKDNKLSFDESKLTASNISSFRSAFAGRSSYGGRVNGRASSLESIANRSLSNGTYNRTGRYSQASRISSGWNRRI